MKTKSLQNEEEEEGEAEEEEEEGETEEEEEEGEAEEEEEESEDEEEESEELTEAEREDEDDEKADASDVSNTRKNPFAGYSRISAKARRKAERNMRSAGKYIGEDESRIDEWERLLTYDGLRRIEDSTLYAKESYKDHELNENDEGLDQRYVDPTLLTYSPEFAAYGDDSYILDPRLLSVYAPMAF